MECLWSGPCILGESPLWHPVEQVCYWVDIIAKKLHRLDIRSAKHQDFSFASEVCCVLPHEKKGLIMALRSSIIYFDTSTEKQTILVNTDDQAVMWNDGHCDAYGRFWIGAKDVIEKKSNASLFSFEKDTLIKQDSGFVVSNGLVFSPDNHFFYVADSPKRIIYRYRFDIEKGRIRDREVFASLLEDAGYPDGMAVDAEGYVWNCHYNGWRVTRYSPDGKVDRVLELPTQAPTSCCFGGESLRTLFITSAARDIEDIEKQPLAGAVFMIQLDVSGLPANVFREHEKRFS